MILSHHRSGSNFLCNLLSLSPKIECLNEPLSMHTDFFKENDLIKWGKNEYNDKILHNSLKNSTGLINYLIEMKNYLNDENVNKIIGIKETLLFEKMEWLKMFLPNLKIIHLVRDPRAVINSAMRNDMYKKWNYEKTVPRYLLKYENIDIDDKNILEIIIWSWKIRYNLFKNSNELFDNITIKLEDIIIEPYKKLDEIMNFIGKETTDEQIDFLQNVYVNGKKGLEFSSYTSKERVLDDWKKRIRGKDEEIIKEKLYREMSELKYI